MNIRMPKKEHLLFALKTELIIFFSGIVFFLIPLWGPIVGGLLFLLGVYYISLSVEDIDTRESLAKTKGDILEAQQKTKNLLTEIIKTKEEVEDAKQKIFNVFSKRGFLTIEERISELEKEIGIERHSGHNLKERISGLEKDIKEIKSDLQKITGKHYW